MIYENPLVLAFDEDATVGRLQRPITIEPLATTPPGRRVSLRPQVLKRPASVKS